MYPVTPEDWNARGPRMSIQPPDSPIRAHELDDTGGIVRFKDGSVVAWSRRTHRLGTPSWCEFTLIDWSR